MIRISYRGHDVVIFIDPFNTEIDCETLGIEVTVNTTDLSTAVRAACALVERALQGRRVRDVA